MKTGPRRILIVAFLATILAGAGTAILLLRIRSSGPQPYSRIEDGLYLGAATSKPPEGTGAVVNLCGRPDSYEVGASLWAPIYESGPGAAQQEPTLELLRRVVNFIDEQRRAGRTTYVHCMVGENRSAAMVTAYVMQEHGMGRDEALAFVQRRRPVARLDPTLMQLLAEWQQLLRRSTRK